MSSTSHQPHETIAWQPSKERNLCSGSLDMSEFAGRTIDVLVDEGQAVLLLNDHQAVAVLLTGLHALDVRIAADEPGSALNEWTSHGHESVAGSSDGARSIVPNTRLLFVTYETAIDLRWGENAPTPFEDRDVGAVPLQISGSFRARVNDPVRFYDSFLRRCEQLDDRQVERVAGALVQDRLHRALNAIAQDVESLQQQIARVQALGAGDLERKLHDVGMEIVEFAVEKCDLEQMILRPHLQPLS